MFLAILGVVIIVKDFNDDMTQYLDKIYKGRPRSERKKKIKPHKMPEVSEEELYVEYDEPKEGFFRRLFRRRPRLDIPEEDLPPEEVEKLGEMEEEIEEVDEEIEELEEVREGMIARFLRSMRMARRGGPTRDELLDDVVPVIDEDVKETLKILHRWLERLPNDQLRAFKTSEDFGKYREVLEKYELIRK